MDPAVTVKNDDATPLMVAESARRLASRKQDFTETGFASNAWGIGKDLTEQGRGALLANPHFPYTGHLRLYQVQMTVPDYLNINGAGLLGTAIPLINYNENLAWSHTNSASRRFTLYELTLKQGDNLTYIKDGEEKPITEKTFEIEVANGSPNPSVLERSFYFSEYGPMLSANALTMGGLPQWGDPNVQGNTVAYTYRDANADTGELLDTWLQMSRATNLDEFQAVFRDNCGSTLWTNVIYADDQGNAFFIDSSSVPNLSPATLATVDFKRRFSADYNRLFENGLTLLDGSTSRDDWVESECGGLVPYEDQPKLQRTDFVQNSNSSHWATNPEQFLTGYSPLFGPERSELNLRTRLGLSMLQNPLESGYADRTPAGQDGRFSAQDLIKVIYNNRAWHAEQLLGELRDRCTAIGTTEVTIPPNLLSSVTPPVDTSFPRSVAAGCMAMQNWDGVYNLDSRGAHLFRVLIDTYTRNFPDDLTVDFNPRNPVNTPASPSKEGAGTPEDKMLQSLAASLEILVEVGIAPNEQLRNVQYYQPSGGVVPGSPPATAMTLSQPIAWHGGDGDIEGTFNALGVANTDFAENTRIPRLNTPEFVVDDGEGNKSLIAGGLSTDPTDSGWKMAQGTSWHFGLEFTDNGPKAFGLMSYSQSTDRMSEFFTDQSQRYSVKDYREFAFTEEEIEANLMDQGEITISE
jgi:acyl-homoserine-lactone acylase